MFSTSSLATSVLLLKGFYLSRFQVRDTDKTGESVLFTLDDLATTSIYPDMPVEILDLDSFTNFTKGTRKPQKLSNKNQQPLSNTPPGFFSPVPITCLLLPCMYCSDSSLFLLHSEPLPAPPVKTLAPAISPPPAIVSQAPATSPSAIDLSAEDPKQAASLDAQTTLQPPAPSDPLPHAEGTQKCIFFHRIVIHSCLNSL